jgi:pyruvate dehydrogenase kinase 2/3/4
MPSVRKVRDWYIQSFKEIDAFPKIKTSSEERKFTELLSNIYNRHSGTLITMARGVKELRQERSRLFNDELNDISDYVEIHQFLDSFYMSRIGLRMLIGQHIELHKQLEHPDRLYSGLICKKTSPEKVARDAIEDARYMCSKISANVPQVTIHGTTGLTFAYVPSHLYYMLFELLKNSLRAVVEFHGDRQDLPQIRVIIADGEDNEDLSIKISDEGGGISRSNLKKIWSYLYSKNVFIFDSNIFLFVSFLNNFISFHFISFHILISFENVSSRYGKFQL